MKQSDAEIANHLTNELSRLIKLLRSKAKNKNSLSLTERSTLGLVYANAEILPSELATTEKVTAQSMSQILNRLFKLGFIKRNPSKTDKRKVFITITATGKKEIEKNKQEKREWLAQAISEKLSSKEKRTLIDAVAVLNSLTETKRN